MLPHFSASQQRQTATKRLVLYCGFACFVFLASLVSGVLQKMQAAENTLPDHQVFAAPTKNQTRLVASYGKLPLSFEANQGQTDSRVRFLARGGGYTIFLTDNEAVLTFRKSQPSVSRLGKFKPPNRFDPSALVDPRTGRWPTFGDGIKSLWQSLIPDLGHMVPDRDTSRGGRNAGLESETKVMRMKLVGGNAKGRIVGLDELPGRSNYFVGNDPKKWRTNVPSYAKVKYKDVYPGVDLVYYGNQRQLEYDFVVAPGADPNQIKLSFAGADGMRVDAASGDLVLKMGDDEVRFRKPAVYQPVLAAVYDRRAGGGKTRSTLGKATPDPRPPTTDTLFGTFELASNNEVAFHVVGYDPKRALVIDPVLSYSTYLGGSGGDDGTGIAVDAAGNAYVTGSTSSVNFPTVNPFQATLNGGSNAFVAKLNAAGSALVYSTYVGGSSAYGDGGGSIALDSSGNAYVTGSTYSTDFPTMNPLQAHCGSCVPNDSSSFTAFVTKLNPTGSALVYSTYLGGSTEDAGYRIAVDAAGSAYVTGYTASTNFPTANPLQPSYGGGAHDAFVAKLNPAGSTLVYSTYLGGSGDEGCSGLAVDASGNAYVTGNTASTDFPTVNPLQPSYGGGMSDAFVAKLNPAGSALVYSTYLGGSGEDVGFRIALDSAGNMYLAGQTASTNFPTANPLQETCDSCSSGIVNVFVTKLNPAGSALVYSTYLNSGSGGYGYGIAVDGAGNAYITGGTGSSFTTSNPLQPSYGGDGADAFVTKLNPTGSALVYSTYLGGSNLDYGQDITVDAAGSAYVTGYTASTNFPTANPFQGTCGSCSGFEGTAFVAKISSVVSLSPTSLAFGTQNVGTTSAPQAVTVTNIGTAHFTISAVAVGGTNADDFALSADTCTGATVTPDGTCNVSVTFTPSATGSLTASLIFTENISDSPQTMGLTGTGTTPVAGVSSPTLVFSSQSLGTTSGSQPITLNNTGSGALTIISIATTTNFGQTNNCAGSVAASGSCTINVTFSPTATGPLTGTLTITDNNNGVAGSTQTVSLSGTGTGPVVSLSAPLTFSGQLVRTTSSSQTITLTNTGNSSLILSAVAVAFPFAIAASGTTCSASTPLAAAATCTVAVTFTPTVAGTASGSLSFSDNAPSSPQTVSLSGTGQDFTFAAASGSSTSDTVAPGSPATYTLSVGGQGGFNQSVSLTCTGAPSEATCTVPNSVTAGSSATNVTVSVTTTAPSASVPRSRPIPPLSPLSPGLRGLLMLALVLAAMAWAIMRRNQLGVGRWQSPVVLLALGFLLTLAVAGCGGGGGGGGTTTPSNPGTPAGTYTLTVTGTVGSGSSAVSHSVALTLTVS